VRFGKRKQADAVDTGGDAAIDPGVEEDAGSPRANGPWDASEVDLTAADPGRVDLGGLIIKGRPGVELRLQLDQASQALVSVLLVASDGAVELRAFSAPRDEDIWTDVRRQIAADAARHGGTATEADGPFGTEVLVRRSVTGPDGTTQVQPSRVVGVPGPRWLLRATYLGRAALEPDPASPLEESVRDIVVLRGAGAMPPGEPIALRLPPGATLPQA
jgi:hypothetical protein